jgi:hypothetical protein
MHSSWPQRQGSSGAAVLHESLQYGVVPGTMHWHCGLLHCFPLMACVIVAPPQFAIRARNSCSLCELEMSVALDAHALAGAQFRRNLCEYPGRAVVHANADAL